MTVDFHESDDERAYRHRKRAAADTFADIWDEVGANIYSDDLVREIAETAGVGAGDRALEVGCGTGHLTGKLIQYRFELTAVDAAPSMIAIARDRYGDAVDWQVCTFEDFVSPDASFRLITSARAFHWVDPEVAWAKAARLLAPGGWFALVDNGEIYDEPFASELRRMWARHTDPRAAWPTRAPTAEKYLASTGLFGPPRITSVEETRVLTTDVVYKLEQTRGITADYPPKRRERFYRELARVLDEADHVVAKVTTVLTMAQRSRRSA
jgi:ubiquinone/menaquinone biosynthesis C-methylase UbiE